MHGHEEAFGRDKGVTMSRMAAVKKERKARVLVAMRERQEKAKM